MLNEAVLTAALSPRIFRFYESVDSTNDAALEWMRAGAPSGAVVIADEQLRGRGRMGRLWHTPPGVALALSVILQPPKVALTQVSMLGALAVYDLLEQIGAQPSTIKWPNDVQLNGLKVCGVLPEVIWDGARLLGAVLGIGVNVRVNFDNTELAMTATSIETVLGHSVQRVELLRLLLEYVDHWAAQIGTTAIFESWRSRLVTTGKMVQIGELNGFAEDVDSEGALLVRTADGVLHRVLAGDIALGG